MRPIAKSKKIDSYRAIPKENKNATGTAPVPSKKWRKQYDCKRTKGQHSWTDMRQEVTGYQFLKPNSPHGWHVDVAVEGKLNSGGYSKDRDFWWGRTISVEEFHDKGIGDGLRYHFRRDRYITCTACGHHEWEKEVSDDDGLTWKPTKSTEKFRIKHGTV